MTRLPLQENELTAIRSVLAAYRSTEGHITEAEITAAWAEYDSLLAARTTDSAVFDPAGVAEGALDRCCEGDPWPTSRNLAEFLYALAALAVGRCVDRLKTQPRSILRWRRTPEHGGRS